MITSNKFTPSVEFHPGLTLSEKLGEMGMDVKEFALRTSKPEKTIHAVINGTSSITSDMAVSFEKVTKIPAHFWLSMQRGYDEYLARKRREEQILASHQWAKSFPLSKMRDLGWIGKEVNTEGVVEGLLSFFGFSSKEAWASYYMGQQLKISFRISLHNTKNPYAVSAWLRQGEIQASGVEVPEFSDKALKKAIPKMKELCARHPKTFAEDLQRLCASAGVKLIYTPCLPQAPISGSTRWINNTPCIQMTGRHKKNDAFWFTFFHELGHILLHGKKDIFLEDIEYTDKEDSKELEADKFSSDILLSQKEEHEIIANGDYSEVAIRGYAKKFGIHPAIIVGRLQHKGIIPYTRHSSLIEKIELY